MSPTTIGFVGPETVIFYPTNDPIPASRDTGDDSETPLTAPAPKTRRCGRIDRASKQVAQLALVVIALLTAGGAWWLFSSDDHAGKVEPAAPAFSTTAVREVRAAMPSTPFPAPAPAAPAAPVDIEEPEVEVPASIESPAEEAPATESPATVAPAPAQPKFGGRPIRPVRTIRMLVTAYSPDERSCGEFADNITASGYSVWTNGMKLVAADKQFAFGTIMTIKGYNDGQPVPVLDRGGAIKGNRLDVLYPTHAIAKQWGKRYIDVVIWEYAD